MEYDNTNKGAGWKVPAVKGTADFGGERYYLAMFHTGASSPTYNIFLTHAETKSVLCCALFKPRDNEAKAFASGQATIGGLEYWVNAYKNDRREHERSPAVNFVFKPKDVQSTAPAEQTEQPADPADAGSGDDIPF